MCSRIVIGVVQSLLFVYNVIPTFSHKFLGRNLGMTMPFVGIKAAVRLFSVTRVSLMAAIQVESRTCRTINLISPQQVFDG